jgi:aspartate aminotransferase-like enzyme
VPHRPENLRTPGPTPLPPQVRQALGRDMINHRGAEFAALLRDCTRDLKTLFQTEHDVLILTASGTGGLESAVVNVLSPGERALFVSVGSFGDRFAQVARAYGADVQVLSYPWGQAANPEDVAARLREDASISAVYVTHNETSTGVMNDLEAIARVVKAADRLLVVDAISSLGAVPLPTDAWGCDVVVTGSQKSVMVPPGLAFVSVSPRAWERAARARMPRFYFDWAHARTFAERGATPWTPAVSLFYALREALQLMLAEGLEQGYARHRRLARYTRDGLRRLGIRLFAPDEHASMTVTAAWVPEGTTSKALRARLRDEFGVVLAGGQGAYEDSLFRIGHLGYVTEADLTQVLDALATVLGRTPTAIP